MPAEIGQIIAIALGGVMAIVILMAFIGSQTIDSYEPPKSRKPKPPKPEPEIKAELPRAIVHRGDE